MKKNFYIYLYTFLFVNLFYNSVIAMETNPPLEVPTEEEKEENYKKDFSPKKNPTSYHHNKRYPSLGNFIRSTNAKPNPDSPPNNPAPNDEPRKPHHDQAPLSLEELAELGVNPETLEDDQWIDALKLHLPSTSGLSSSEQKAREEATVRMYSIVAEVLQQKKLARELNRLKVHNEVQQVCFLSECDFPELHGKVLARTKLAQDNFKLNYALQHPTSYLGSLVVQAIEAGIVRGISVCGELAGATFYKNAIEPSLTLGIRTIYENITENGRKQKIDRQYIENQNEIQLTDVFIKQNTERMNAAKRQEYMLKNNLQKYSTKLKQTKDPHKVKKYKKKIDDYALSLIDNKDTCKQTVHSNELLAAEMCNRHKHANTLIQERYKHSSFKSSKDREKRAQKIAEQYLDQKPPGSADVGPLNIESPFIEEELLS
jgi:hypothetical protein